MVLHHLPAGQGQENEKENTKDFITGAGHYPVMRRFQENIQVHVRVDHLSTEWKWF